MTDKNQYRCETCDFKGKGMMGDERCPYDTQKSNEDNCDLLYRYKRTTEEKELMNLCGLTCHSDLSDLLSVSSPTHCPECGAQVMRHFWCIDEDCGWDSAKEEKARRREKK